MPTELYNSFNVQVLLFLLLAAALLISVISLFIKPAKRTIRASLVEADTGHIIDISKAETSIGRSKSCDIIITDASVSRFHAVLAKRSAGWMIFDTNSTHGIILNSETVEKKAALEDGDFLIFGTTQYIFYSTAVTTRQQIVPKSQKHYSDDTPPAEKKKTTQKRAPSHNVSVSVAGRKQNSSKSQNKNQTRK